MFVYLCIDILQQSPPPLSVRPDKNVLATTQLLGRTAPQQPLIPPSHNSHPAFTLDSVSIQVDAKI